MAETASVLYFSISMSSRRKRCGSNGSHGREPDGHALIYRHYPVNAMKISRPVPGSRTAHGRTVDQTSAIPQNCRNRGPDRPSASVHAAGEERYG